MTLHTKTCLSVLLLLSFSSLFFSNLASAQSLNTTIFIRPDGSVSPSNVPIQRNGDIYTFTGDVFDPILVQKSNITIDGAGYSLIGPLTEEQKNAEEVLGLGPNTTVRVPIFIIGIDFQDDVSGVTVKNLNIEWFYIGIYVRTMRNELVNCAVSDNIVGVLLSGSANGVTNNYISDNKQGLFFGFEQVNGSAFNIPSDIIISENSFVENIMQLSGCVCEVYNFSEAKHAWDYNEKGNYWSDYNGTDSNGDGIGDTYYVIDPLNYDRYPLIESPAQPPTPAFPFLIALIVVISIVIVVIVVLLVLRNVRKRPKHT